VLSVNELSELIGCAEMTIRRHLDSLEERNLVVRRHGCAYLTNDAKPTIFDEQIKLNSREKFLIAHEASKMIRPNSTICFDSGTTIHRIVNLIDPNIRFTAITPSLPFATELAKLGNVKIIMHSGTLNKNNLTLEYAPDILQKKINVDISFISCRSFKAPNGTYEHTDTLIANKRWFANIGKKTVLLADSSKWLKRSVQLCVSLKNIDTIITDSKILDEDVNLIRKLGKEIIVVSDVG